MLLRGQCLGHCQVMLNFKYQPLPREAGLVCQLTIDLAHLHALFKLSFFALVLVTSKFFSLLPSNSGNIWIDRLQRNKLYIFFTPIHYSHKKCTPPSPICSFLILSTKKWELKQEATEMGRVEHEQWFSGFWLILPGFPHHIHKAIYD